MSGHSANTGGLQQWFWVGRRSSSRHDEVEHESAEIYNPSQLDDPGSSWNSLALSEFR
jgi:hypothetical protein